MSIALLVNTMKIQLPLVLLLICSTCHGTVRKGKENIDTRHRDVDDGSKGSELNPLLQWTMVEEEEEEVIGELARLREAILQAVQSNRSRTALPTSAAARVTSIQLTFLDLWHLYLPSITKVNNQCRRDLFAIYASVTYLDYLLERNELWPITLIDSWGKLGDGLLVGNMKQLGFFKECLDIKVFQYPRGLHQLQRLLWQLLNLTSHPDNSMMEDETKQRLSQEINSSKYERKDIPPANFSGQYCLVTYRRSAKELHFPPGFRTPALSAILPFGLSMMAYGTCMPSTCTREELQETVNEALEKEGLSVDILDCQVRDDHSHPLQGSEITGIVLLTDLVLLLVTATCADVVTLAESRHHLRKGPLRYLLAFSINTNLKKIMHMETRKLPGVIPCIHGIRFLSISWVVMGHQFAYSLPLSQNSADLVELSKRTYAQFVTNADLSVDSFFTLGGLFVTLALLGMVKKTGRFNLPLYIFHRLLRLWPPVVLTVVLVATVSGLAVSGPFAELYWSSVVKGCRHSWWMDISLTTNLFFPYLDRLPKDPGEAACCLPHIWYLGVDTQLYLIMPLLLLPLAWWPRKGMAWLGVWTAASVITPAAITGAYHLWPSSLMVIDPAASLQFNHKVYLMPWCRAGPYLVGAWTGYLIYYSRENPAITRLKLWQVFVGWGAAVAMALAVLFGIAPYNYLGTPSEVPEMSTAAAVLYGGLHRAVWGAALSWVIVACTWGYGGPAASILEHPFWQPLSRLSYCIYLTSMPIQLMVLYSTKRPTFFSYYAKMQETAGVMVVIVAVSMAVSLISESPILNLEKMLLQKRTEDRPRLPPEDNALAHQHEQEDHDGGSTRP